MNGVFNRFKTIIEVIGQGSLIGVSFSLLLLFLLEMYFEKVYFYESNKIILYSEIAMSVLVFFYSLYAFKKWTKNL
jgi:hypothetical protein